MSHGVYWRKNVSGKESETQTSTMNECSSKFTLPPVPGYPVPINQSKHCSKMDKTHGVPAVAQQIQTVWILYSPGHE